MKKYNMPKIEVLRFETEDVITDSGIHGPIVPPDSFHREDEP